MVAIKTHPEQLSLEQEAMRLNGVRDLDAANIPLGHVLSVLVEVLGDYNPDIHRYIAGLNKSISLGGNGFAKFNDLSEPFRTYLSKRLNGLDGYLSEFQIDGKITREGRQFVMNVARGYPQNYRSL